MKALANVALFVLLSGACGGANKGAVNDGGGGGGDGGQEEGVRAFPGAEGYAALATGGRGGRVIKVKTLDATGPGSLQEALSQDEARIIVFEVSGVIEGDFEIEYGNVTIAGQTAPGAGITIVGRLSGAYEFGIDNMIIRHIRVRPIYDGSDGQQFDAMQFSRNSRIILDHVSASFAVDETIDFYESKDITIQWSTIESSATQGHPEGEHNYGLINGPDGARISVHHNLFAHHKNRSPAIANGPSEVRNNVMYNVRHGFIHHNPASGAFNIVGNYFKKGGDDVLIPFYFDDEDNFAAADLRYYLADNTVDDPSSSCNGVVENPWSECDQDLLAPEARRADSEFEMTGQYWARVSAQASADAYDSVLAKAGAFPRDLVTRQSVQQTKDRTGAWGSYALPNPLDGLQVGSTPSDTDDDGIPDEWETSHGLSASDPSDNQKTMESGYPAIEEYINELADSLLP